MRMCMGDICAGLNYPNFFRGYSKEDCAINHYLNAATVTPLLVLIVMGYLAGVGAAGAPDLLCRKKYSPLLKQDTRDAKWKHSFCVNLQVLVERKMSSITIQFRIFENKGI